MTARMEPSSQEKLITIPCVLSCLILFPSSHEKFDWYTRMRSMVGHLPTPPDGPIVDSDTQQRACGRCKSFWPEKVTDQFPQADHCQNHFVTRWRFQSLAYVHSRTNPSMYALADRQTRLCKAVHLHDRGALGIGLPAAVNGEPLPLCITKNTAMSVHIDVSARHNSVKKLIGCQVSLRIYRRMSSSACLPRVKRPNCGNTKARQAAL